MCNWMEIQPECKYRLELIRGLWYKSLRCAKFALAHQFISLPILSLVLLLISSHVCAWEVFFESYLTYEKEEYAGFEPYEEDAFRTSLGACESVTSVVKACSQVSYTKTIDSDAYEDVYAEFGFQWYWSSDDD